MTRVYQKCNKSCYPACVASLFDMSDYPDHWVPKTHETANEAHANISKFLKEKGLVEYTVNIEKSFLYLDLKKLRGSLFISVFYPNFEDTFNPQNHCFVSVFLDITEEGEVLYIPVHNPSGKDTFPPMKDMILFVKQPSVSEDILEDETSFNSWRNSLEEFNTQYIRKFPTTIPDGSPLDPFNLERGKADMPAVRSDLSSALLSSD